MKRLVNSLIIAILAASAVVSAPLVDVMVRPMTEVSTTDVKLGDIAVVKSKNAALATKIAEISVCAAPLAGRSRVLTREQLLVTIRKYGIADGTVGLLCPAQATVSRAVSRIPGQALFDTVREFVNANKTWTGNAEVESVRLPNEQVVPTGPLEIRVRDNGSKPRKGRASFPVDILVDGQVYSTLYIAVNIRVFAPVVIATQPIARGGVIDSSNSALDTREVTTASEDALSQMPVDGSTATQSIPVGTVVRRSWVTEAMAIKAGDKVTVVVRGDTICISDKGVAAADGRPGDTIKVKLSGDLREIRAKVVESGLVEIRLAKRS